MDGSDDAEAWCQDVEVVLDRARGDYGQSSLFAWSGGAFLSAVVANRYAALHRHIYAAPAFFLRAPIVENMSAWSQVASGDLPVPYDALHDFAASSNVRGFIAHDPQRLKSVPRRLAVALESLRRRAIDDAHCVGVPTMTLLAGQDTIVDNAATFRLLAIHGEVVQIDGGHGFVLEHPHDIGTRVVSFLKG